MASIFLIVVALTAGMVGCDGDGESYALAITSTAAGNVTTPGEGMFVYDADTVVDLVATSNAGYCFVNWTGDVDTIVSVNAAATNITMNGHYLITANFGLFAGGDGTAEYPYRIADWWCLNNARDYLSSHFIVINDLDSNSAGYMELASPTANQGKGWEPIGTLLDGKFVGAFDGQGYEICDLFINRPDEREVGLFGAVGSGGVIQNTGVVNVDVTGSHDVGGLMGANAEGGTLSNSYATGSVTGGGAVGGLVGWNDGTVSHSYSTSGVTGGNEVGGLVGENERGTVSNSYATGNVSGTNGVGGLIGMNTDGTLSNSYATGNVIASRWFVGGLVGWNDEDSHVINSYSTGSVTGDDYVGGLAGENDGIITYSFWDTETSGQAAPDGGTGKTTAEMQDVTTFLEATWLIVAVASPDTRNPSYIWNIVDGETYPFLSWEP